MVHLLKYMLNVIQEISKRLKFLTSHIQDNKHAVIINN